MNSILEKEKTTLKIKKPNMWNVVFHNDDTTHFEFVIFLLVHVFQKDALQAIEITKTIHNSGKGVAGTYTKEIAETKQRKSLDFAKEFAFPLVITLEQAN